jgi:predicted transcriptional regulator
MSEPVGEESVDELDPDEIFFVKEDYSAEVVDTDRVADWMTPKVISVAPDAAIEEVCRVMIEEHIHRVFVAEKGKLLGVISSFDVVRHVARAAARRGPAARSAPVQRRALAARRPAAPRARS